MSKSNVPYINNLIKVSTSYCPYYMINKIQINIEVKVSLFVGHPSLCSRNLHPIMCV